MDEPLAHLPEAYARYFELRRLGLRLDEIAVELGIPPGALEAFVALAHSKIRNAVDD